MEKQVTISAPWEAHKRKLEALFAQDSEVTVEATFTAEERHIAIRVENPAKAEALGYLLPTEVEFGNVKVAINVIPANKPTVASLLRTAFAGNPALKGVTVVKGAFDTNAVTYAEFEPRVVQYWNDDLSNPHGVTTTLMETLAADVLTGPGAEGATITSAYIDKEGR